MGFALDSSWEIGNELAVLFGYSGSGKSLTLQLIAGLMKPDSGVITTKRTKLASTAQRTLTFLPNTGRSAMSSRT